jgi:hypothetical protein
MIKKLRNQPYAPKWEQEEKKTLSLSDNLWWEVSVSQTIQGTSRTTIGTAICHETSNCSQIWCQRFCPEDVDG